MNENQRIVGHVTVTAGEGATVRAVEAAQRVYGPNVTVEGLEWLDSGRRYRYAVVTRRGSEG